MTNTTSFDFTGTRVLVTGGTSGIGHATARAFAHAGAQVAVTGTREDPADYDTDLGGFTYHPLQMTDPDSIDALVGALGEGDDPLDVLVNNAGANLPGGRDEWDPDVFAETIDLNLVGTMRLTSGCRPLLAASEADGGASVVMLASMSSYRAVPIVPAYGSAKAATVLLVQNLAVHWVGDAIRVNAVAPGLIDTPMTAPVAAIPQLLDPALAEIPMGAMGTPEDVAACILFLSSSTSRYTTGTVFAVDGGFLAR